MPAAVTALMGTIPAEQAGVGSALNDTIQQAGSRSASRSWARAGQPLHRRECRASAPAEARHSIAGAIRRQGDADKRSLIHTAT